MEITKLQKHVAKLLQINIEPNESFGTLKAKLVDEIAEAIGEKVQEEATEKQTEYGESLGIALDKESKRVASAKIADKLEQLNKEALSKLNIEPGSNVRVNTIFGLKDYVVSSIKENGKIYFKGIGCPQAWASKIEKVIES